MKAIISTYGTACGLATYAENLVSSSEDDWLVLGEDLHSGYTQRPDGLIPDLRCWSRLSSDYSRLQAALRFENCRTVVFNYEYSLFCYTPAFDELVENLKKDGRDVWFILHSVVPHRGPFAWCANVFKMATGIIVHSELARSILAAEGIAAHIIEHGTEFDRPIPKKEARKSLKLPADELIALTLGFITEDKRLIEIAHACTQVYCLIAGHPVVLGENDLNRRYAETLKKAIQNKPNCRFDKTWLTREEIRTYYSAADFAIFYYKSHVASTSGAARMALTYGLPTIISNAPRLEDLQSSSIVVSNDNELAAAIKQLTSDKQLYTRLSEAAVNHAKASEWDFIASIYEQTLK